MQPPPRPEALNSEITAIPLHALTVNATVGYIDAKYQNFVAPIIAGPPTDNNDFPFPYTSKWTTSLGESYRVALPSNIGSIEFNADWDYRSDYSAVANLPYPAARVEGFGLLDAAMKFTDNSGRYSLTLYGQKHHEPSMADFGSDGPGQRGTLLHHA